ncbi:hypothetical protein RJ639_022361 [Escallonia herrerae]|uniref:Reverse transcriptase/retrotransposon-derived protein RNase H-like domain-containing protein n=1 Tax=Escallonia herrerae TaxID=1293975 RepID=A0AA88V3Z9_9ASTE|nr:hypothetical protein RJ639_022361 [Escallonia herrerae]
MAHSVERCLPFFKAITKAKDFAWTEDCQKSFEEFKMYLSFPPLLTKPLSGEDLFLYPSVIKVTVSAVLIGEWTPKANILCQQVLPDVEMRYPMIDKIELALITLARHLRPDFQSHTIVVLTDQPLRKVLLSLEAS